jgi:hypothetical protein
VTYEEWPDSISLEDFESFDSAEEVDESASMAGPAPIVAVVAVPTSASPRWSTASWAAARRWLRMCQG